MRNIKYEINDHPLITKEIIPHIEKSVSKFLDREWQVKSWKNLNDLASHPSAILSDNDYSIFVKLNQASSARDQFEYEVKGLEVIREFSEVKTPLAIGVKTLDSCSLLIMEALKEVERKSCHWRDIGRSLAKLHKIKSDYFGFKRNFYQLIIKIIPQMVFFVKLF